MASYDLTPVLAKNLDKHLVFPLLEFLSNKRMYPEPDLEKAKIELVQKTNMIDYLIDIWTIHHNKQEPPQEFQDRRNEVVAKLSTLQVMCSSKSGILREVSILPISAESKFWVYQA